MNRKYQPSNGTEGMAFWETYCFNCIHENPDQNKKPKCKILSDTMVYDVKDDKYPKEWTYDENDRPCCTKFSKWDWGNDGDPDKPDNPKYVPPDDPMQLCFPFITDDILRGHEIKEKV